MLRTPPLFHTAPVGRPAVEPGSMNTTAPDEPSPAVSFVEDVLAPATSYRIFPPAILLIVCCTFCQQKKIIKIFLISGCYYRLLAFTFVYYRLLSFTSCSVDSLRNLVYDKYVYVVPLCCTCSCNHTGDSNGDSRD